MRFDDRFLDEVKTRLRLSDVIGRTVNLKRQGREYVGLSPFTKERSPSFFVNDEKGFFHDFSSGKHGDLISFLQETERLSFPEAVERLASEAGVPMPTPDPRAAEQEKERASLGDWLEQAARWYEAQLRRPGAEAARSYLHKRGLPEGQWSRFRIGYAPGGRTGLKDYLVSKGALPKELFEAGVLIEPEGGGQPYDRFRERIIFPIADIRGRVVSFGGRALNPEARAKYLNGPETPVFHKGGMLYGMGEARRLLHVGGEDTRLVVVEGYMDVIACQRADIPAVAPMGTALTEDQMAALWRLHPEPTLCFDADAAGQRAAGRAVERALPLLKPGRSFNFALISGGKDPDDVLREQGAGALKAQLAVTKPFVEVLFDKEKDGAGPGTPPERRAEFKNRLRQFANSIADRDLSDLYREDLFNRFYTYTHTPRFRRDKAKYNIFDDIANYVGKNTRELLNGRIRTLSAAVAVAAIEHPAWIRPYVQELSEFGFGDDRLDKLVQPLMDVLFYDDPTPQNVLESLKRARVMAVLERAYHFAKEVPAYSFVDNPEPSRGIHEAWMQSYLAVSELWTVENELKARENGGPLDEDVANLTAHLARGRWLRDRKIELAQQIHSGEVWRPHFDQQAVAA